MGFGFQSGATCLKLLSHITDGTVHVIDGSIGKITTAFFDEQSWAIRYLVVDTWLPGRSVLISTYCIKPPLGNLTRCRRYSQQRASSLKVEK